MQKLMPFSDYLQIADIHKNLMEGVSESKELFIPSFEDYANYRLNEAAAAPAPPQKPNAPQAPNSPQNPNAANQPKQGLIQKVGSKIMQGFQRFGQKLFGGPQQQQQQQGQQQNQTDPKAVNAQMQQKFKKNAKAIKAFQQKLVPANVQAMLQKAIKGAQKDKMQNVAIPSLNVETFMNTFASNQGGINGLKAAIKEFANTFNAPEFHKELAVSSMNKFAADLEKEGTNLTNKQMAYSLGRLENLGAMGKTNTQKRAQERLNIRYADYINKVLPALRPIVGKIEKDTGLQGIVKQIENSEEEKSLALGLFKVENDKANKADPKKLETAKQQYLGQAAQKLVNSALADPNRLYAILKANAQQINNGLTTYRDQIFPLLGFDKNLMDSLYFSDYNFDNQESSKAIPKGQPNRNLRNQLFAGGDGKSMWNKFKMVVEKAVLMNLLGKQADVKNIIGNDVAQLQQQLKAVPLAKPKPAPAAGP